MHGLIREKIRHVRGSARVEGIFEKQGVKIDEICKNIWREGLEKLLKKCGQVEYISEVLALEENKTEGIGTGEFSQEDILSLYRRGENL